MSEHLFGDGLTLEINLNRQTCSLIMIKKLLVCLSFYDSRVNPLLFLCGWETHIRSHPRISR
jgi:hypothetical protein